MCVRAQVYRVSDMRIVRVVPIAEDEVNCACFHPTVGGGLAYGTKEGRLRILKHNRPPPLARDSQSRNRNRHPESAYGLEDELLETEGLAEPQPVYAMS